MDWLFRLFGGKSKSKEPALVARMQKEAGNVYVLRLGGIFNKPTLDNIQKIAAQDIERGAKDIRVLIILTDFRGWRQGDDWGDMDFFSRHEPSIAKIAVIGDPRWESETLMFICANRRTGSVKYFSPDLESSAREWLKS